MTPFSIAVLVGLAIVAILFFVYIVTSPPKNEVLKPPRVDETKYQEEVEKRAREAVKTVHSKPYPWPAPTPNRKALRHAEARRQAEQLRQDDSRRRHEDEEETRRRNSWSPATDPAFMAMQASAFDGGSHASHCCDSGSVSHDCGSSFDSGSSCCDSGSSCDAGGGGCGCD